MNIKTRLIEGDLDLMLGSKLMAEMELKIDVAQNAICYKDGKWIKTVISNHGHIILPAPTKEDLKLKEMELKFKDLNFLLESSLLLNSLVIKAVEEKINNI